jgi:hypothetical protein
MKSARSDAMRCGARRHAERGQLSHRDHAVLRAGEAGNRVIEGWRGARPMAVVWFAPRGGHRLQHGGRRRACESTVCADSATGWRQPYPGFRAASVGARARCRPPLRMWRVGTTVVRFAPHRARATHASCRLGAERAESRRSGVNACARRAPEPVQGSARRAPLPSRVPRVSANAAHRCGAFPDDCRPVRATPPRAARGLCRRCVDLATPPPRRCSGACSRASGARQGGQGPRRRRGSAGRWGGGRGGRRG